MKSQVIEALRKEASNPKERFQELFTLYRNEKTASFALKRFFNASGYSPANLKTLEYELKKLFKITDKDVADTVNFKPVVTKQSTEEKVIAFMNQFPDPYDESGDVFVVTKEMKEALCSEELLPLTKLDKIAEIKIPKWSKGIEGNKERKEFLEGFGVTDIPKKNKELDDAIAEAIENSKLSIFEAAYNQIEEEYTKLFQAEEAKAVKVITDASPEAQAGLKLRDEYPFLFADDCPDKLKILVADKITAFDKVIKGRQELKNMDKFNLSLEEIYAAATIVVENFELNQLIYDELNYYKEHGELLGKHPIFAEEVLIEQVNNMSTKELIKRQKNLRSYISRDSKVLEKLNDGEEKETVTAKVAEWQHELEMIDARLESIK